MSHDVLIEKLQNQRDTIGKNQMLKIKKIIKRFFKKIIKNTPKFLKLDKYLGHEFKLVDMVDFEMFEKQQQNRRYSFDNDFFVTVDVDS